MTDEDRIADLLIEWEDAFEQGRDVPVDELCKECPELAREVAEGIESLKRTRWLQKVGQRSSEPPPASAYQVGQVLANRFRLDRQVGSGGFGEVWQGFDQQLQRTVAIKVPRPSRLPSPEQLEDFLAEVRKVASLEHPGIVPIFDVAREGDFCFLVSQFVEGGSLADVLAKRNLTPAAAARFVAQIAEALHYAHQRGFIHRDVKAANVLIDQHGRALLCDFGIAVASGAPTGPALGTLRCMSPEQLFGDDSRIDHRTDIYGLGVLLYELLTGDPPFSGSDPSTVKEKILHDEPLPPRSINRAIPSELERICLKCLAKSPTERYTSAQALADDLALHTTRKQRKSWGAWVGGVFLLAALALALGVGTRQTRGPGPDIAEQGTSRTQTKPTTSDLSTTPDTLPETEPPVELFNGNNLDGWKAFLKTDEVKPDDVFKVKDGNLICTGEGKGYLRSSTEFKNFILRLEWRLPPGGTIGKLGGSVLVRMTGPERMMGRWPEIKIGDGKTGDLIWVSGKFKTRRTLFNEKTVGEWNQLSVICEGSKVTVILNDKMVNRAEGVDVEAGNVGIMSQVTEFWVRKVQVAPIKERKGD